MDIILDQKVLAPASDGPPELPPAGLDAKPSLLGLALHGLALSSHSLNPQCEPALSLVGAAVDQPNVPGLPFSARISCPRLDPDRVFVFVSGKEHHDVRVTHLGGAASSSLSSESAAAAGSEITFVHGLNATSFVSIVAADVDGHPFTGSFPLHYEDPATELPSSYEPVGFWDSALSMVGEVLHFGAAPSESHDQASSSSSPSLPSSPSSSPPSPSAAKSAAKSACFKKNPAYPMLRAECQDPPRQQCDFYQSCVEASVPCAGSPASYALDLGLKNCVKFQHNLRLFSARGNAFIWDTMHCLQRALVPAVSDCAGPGDGDGHGHGDDDGKAGPTCQSIHDAAFASHARCYVDSGFCSLQCSDYLAELFTVGTDLFSVDTVKAMAEVAGDCLHNVTQIIEKGSCMGDGLKGIVTTAFRVLAGEGP
ncbi:hypothetical protein ESCO_002107 [Escovopsis weberi]|uniref:Uncharacterized protein n=1 Tax=Escovopsis weberi TaxID=150374 RepID=A0A0M9VWT2_ESCWE|nr:hypothetical protein ESCO_002107 [Escovopsis weberi]